MNTLTIQQKSSNFKLMGGRFQQHFDYFNACVKNEEDLKGFYGMFDGNVVKSINVFRQQKINELGLTLDQFVSAYNNDQREALELLFQHTVHDDQLELLNESNINPSDLYHKFKLSPSNNLVSLINNFDMIGYKWDGDDTFLLNI